MKVGGKLAKPKITVTQKQKELLMKKQVKEKVKWLIGQERDIKAREILTDILTYNVDVTLMELEGFTREGYRITYNDIYKRVLLKRLTNRQYTFCKTYIETGDVQVSKYKAGYKVTDKTNPLDLPLIREYLELNDTDVTKEKETKVLTNHDIQEILSEIALSGKEKTSDRLKALDILKNVRKNEVELRTKEEELAREKALVESDIEESEEEILKQLINIQNESEETDKVC